MRCNECKQKIDDKASFCPFCGTPIEVKKSKDIKQNIIIFFEIIIILFIINYFTHFIIGFLNLSTKTVSVKNPHPQENKIYEEIKKSEVYKYEPFGIYVYIIPKNKFNLKKFVNYSQKLKRGKSGYISAFVFNKEIYIDELDNVDKSLPLYLLDAMWNQYPYFYFSHADNHSEQFCKINSGEQKHYYRNIVKGEKLFTYIKTYKYDRLNASTGCVIPKENDNDNDFVWAKKTLESVLSTKIEDKDVLTWLDYAKAYKQADLKYYNYPCESTYRSLVLAHSKYKEFEEFLKYSKYAKSADAY